MNPLQFIAYMPLPAKVSSVMIGGGMLSYFVYAMFGYTGMMILMAGCVVVGLVLFAYGYIIKHVQRKKGASFGQEVVGQGSATPQAISRAEQLAKLDDLRKRFDDGVEKFRAAGKNLYSLPWYMVMGEPGSGKSEAVRHSNIGFPPGLQDELQGVGGTINMHWWFANQSVILDLAGRLVFEEVQPGITSEWQTFLKLLKANRPNCPINGLILVIPADTLVKDPVDALQRKATKLSRQLDTIQRALDIRFPVFVVITKADLILGFREFFEDMHSPEEVYQMVGWSNPNSIDEPFSPESTDQYLDVVQERLLRRRYHLIQNPEPTQDLSDSRFDEVDTLYLFLESFKKVIPPLKRYLQSLFVSTEWSSKPLFLRGIYLTSSMREGVALDEELAKAMGVSLDALPEGRLFEKERSFFLRDTFISKIFAEKGLVTRATNVSNLYRKRRGVLLGVGVTSVLALLALTWLGGRSLHNSIGKERNFWAFAAERVSGKSKSADGSLAIVAREESGGGYAYRGPAQIRVGNERMNLTEYHDQLHKIVQKSIRIPAIFKLSQPFARSLNDDRRTARRVVYDLGVLGPAVDSAREKMVSETKAADWTPAATAALRELIRIEADRLKLEYSRKSGWVTPLDTRAMFQYLLTADDFRKYDGKDQTVLGDAMTWSYTTLSSGGGGGTWPPVWLSRGTIPTNRSLDVGVTRFIEYCCASPDAVDLDEQLAEIRALWAHLEQIKQGKDCAEAEQKLLEFLRSNADKLRTLRGFEEIEPEWTRQYAELSGIMANVRQLFARIEEGFRKISLLREADIVVAYNRLVASILQQAEQRMGELPLPGGPTAVAGADAGRDASLADDIRARMKEALDAMRNRYPPKNAEDLKAFAAVCAEVRQLVAEREKRFAIFEPVTIPEKLRYAKVQWSKTPSRMAKMDATDLNAELQKVCRKIDVAFGGFSGIATNQARDAFSAIRARAALGLDNIGSTNFTRIVLNDMVQWGRMPEDSLMARGTVISMLPEEFGRTYLVNTKPRQDDYAAQYWEERTCEALESLADETPAEAKRLVARLKPFARFPLAMPGSNILTRAEFFEAAKVLAAARTMGSSSGGKTIGEGANTGSLAVDEQLARLRMLELGESVNKWIRAATAVVQAMPPDAKQQHECKVRVLAVAQQDELARRDNRNLKDDGISFLCPFVMFTQGGDDAARRIKSTRPDAMIADVDGDRYLYPSETVAIKFYSYWSDLKRAEIQPYRSEVFEGSWALLAIVHRPRALQYPADPKRWIAEIATEDANGHMRFLWIEMEFQKPLPSINDWPRRPESF